MLETKWQTSLVSEASVVNSLINNHGVYAGSDGYVLRLDPSDGTVMYKNDLKGCGYGEVRLAATLDGEMLVAGLNGHVIGLGIYGLDTLWSTDLGTGGTIVSVVCGRSGIYAGSNGYVYRLNPHTGSIIRTNDLPGYRKHETRLGLLPSTKWLLVGINGYTLCLDTNSLETQWVNDMPGAGKDLTSVVGGIGFAYGACNGRVFALQDWSGTLLNENDLSGTGNNEVRMALDTTTSRLYVGTNGYGICLDARTLQTKYQTSLPGCGYHVTDVAFGDQGVAWFACHGYVYQLNPSGQVQAQNDLKGRSTFETRLAASSSGDPELIVGIGGYALGLDIANSPLPVDFTGQTFAVTWQPWIIDIFNWRTYDPSTIDGVGILIGNYEGRLIGEDMKTRTCTFLRPNWEGNSYTWVFRPDGAIIYKFWDHDDRSKYTRHSQLGNGAPVICAGEFRLSTDSNMESVIAMVNDASGHYKPDGGACLRYVSSKFENLGIDTSETVWYWRIKEESKL
ncbi:hypothetical protein CFD26_104476 [Aspergillus turcosus]|uniref:Uncharacterized protein n=1 Tax=Aspergillus turcosus TaxID=1245748 RepID=A0A421D0B6_9EURO|nr:hypothetical protein CFD26_104476 [Aspergillus turcosus]